jgi:hypothetical protein
LSWKDVKNYVTPRALKIGLYEFLGGYHRYPHEKIKKGLEMVRALQGVRK